MITEDKIQSLLLELRQARERARVRNLVREVISEIDSLDHEDVVELYNAFVARLCATRDT